MKNKTNIFSREYAEIINLYKKLHVTGTEFDDAQNTFDGKSLKFFFHPIKHFVFLHNLSLSKRLEVLFDPIFCSGFFLND